MQLLTAFNLHIAKIVVNKVARAALNYSAGIADRRGIRISGVIDSIVVDRPGENGNLEKEAGDRVSPALFALRLLVSTCIGLTRLPVLRLLFLYILFEGIQVRENRQD